MIPHLPHVLYGAVIGHFIMALWRKLFTTAPNLIIVPSKPHDGPMFMSRGYPPPRKLANGSWAVESALLDAMRGEGYLFNTRTGGWDNDPNYVEPPEYEAMPF